jgi:pimeloyl-ACP methyl ester carboxylesterase
MGRASEAAARAFWPLGATKLEKRLGLIAAPTLLLWGEKDAVLPPSYAKKFAAGINGGTRIETVPEAGHLAYLDRPEAVARAVLAHFG